MFRVSPVVVLVSFVLAGCSGEADNRPARSPVSGVVKYKGQPVDGANIIFSPTSGGQPAAAAVTDAEGTFSLKTFEDGDGAVPGNYQVAISKTTSDAKTVDYGDTPPPDYDGTSPTVKTTDHLPKKYKIAAKSGLTATVKEGDNEPIEFDLKD